MFDSELFNKSLTTILGIYELIFSSKLPQAISFRKWVFSEVLPSLRKTGTYTITNPLEKIQSITFHDLLMIDEQDLHDYKTILKSHVNLLKDPIQVERGRRGGLKTQNFYMNLSYLGGLLFYDTFGRTFINFSKKYKNNK